jgi:hypothetical protein
LVIGEGRERLERAFESAHWPTLIGPTKRISRAIRVRFKNILRRRANHRHIFIIARVTKIPAEKTGRRLFELALFLKRDV